MKGEQEKGSPDMIQYSHALAQHVPSTDEGCGDCRLLVSSAPLLRSTFPVVTGTGTVALTRYKSSTSVSLQSGNLHNTLIISLIGAASKILLDEEKNNLREI